MDEESANYLTEMFAYEGIADRPLKLSLSENWGADPEVYNLEYYRTEGRWDIAFDPEFPFIYSIDSASHLVVMKFECYDNTLDDIKDGFALHPTFKVTYEPHTFILADVPVERGYYFMSGQTKVYLGRDSKNFYIVFDSSYLCSKR